MNEQQEFNLERLLSEDVSLLFSAPNQLGICAEDEAYQLIAETMGFDLVANNAQVPNASDIISSVSQAGLSADWCVMHGIFPLIKSSQTSIITNDFLKHDIIGVLMSALNVGDDVEIKLITPSMLNSLVDEVERERAVSELLSSKISSSAALAEEAPIINLVNGIIDRAIIQEASDIHIEAGEQSFNIRLRIDGKMQSLMHQPMSRFAAVASRIKLLSDLDIAERRLPQDGRFSVQSGPLAFDIRVSTAPDVHGESIVLRLLPKKRDQLSLDNLGFEQSDLNKIKQWGALPNGIVLVTGPTGSGKSTTLYALLSEIKTGTEKIVTVEDPVEYQLEGITQVQARSDIGYTFAKALRTFLRQDPDVIMVGEIRDKETADISVQSSLTGHLVLSTLHTNDACSVFPRLSDIGIEPYLVAATVQGVQAQRLVRKLCEKCSEPTVPPEFLTNTAYTDSNWRKPKGCSHCSNKGYKGRIGIYELVEVSASLRELIANGASLESLRAQAKKDGAKFLFDDGLIKASRGITSVDEVLRVCSTNEETSV
ncbi:GspE/PulE family protein [Glaciecola sp. KUL10]|uniref:GspE/PulE family protein n=1 Tax=Glaciecola sp. (strain KUL10) TaxID=2161813 RepID=UPI001F3E57B9|nr:GspE/PulE family protein [Glaciecola sp. KUL10]